ncbi:transport between ER and Golgi ATPase protein [Mortierella sp. GBA30]|nr:transport between ER and Golgi ATPase protein [Mortierella sp. GBA30]
MSDEFSPLASSRRLDKHSAVTKAFCSMDLRNRLNGRKPKTVNNSEVLSKFVGQSEENIHKQFIDAEKKHRDKGEECSLHNIIFDELEAIFKQRGSKNDRSWRFCCKSASRVDGVEQLNSILVIGMTNRKDMIDEALLRPSRTEVHVEIGLPDEHGRLQI